MRDGEAHRLLRTWRALSGGRIISLSDSQREMVTHTARAVPVKKRDLSAHVAESPDADSIH
jgi:hypothetical protein